MKRAVSVMLLVALVAAAGNLSADELGNKLIRAAEEGKLAEVKSLLGQGAGVNSRDGEAQTPLIVAAGKGHRDVVVYLLDNGADINLMNYRIGVTALGTSVADTEMLRLLLDRGADPNAGYPSLVSAASIGNTEAVKLLLEAGADINAKGVEGTALAHACMRGNADVVRLLLEWGADPYAVDSREGSLYEIAADNKHGDIIPILLAAGVQGPASVIGRLTVFDAPSLPVSELSDLVGTWHNPVGMAVPGVHAKEVYNSDLTGGLYDEIDDTQPMAAFTYKVTWRSTKRGTYNLLVDYGTWNQWFGLVRFSERNGTKEWDTLGKGVQALPEETNPQSQYYSKTFRKVEGRNDTKWLVGTWINPAGASTRGVIGKEIYNADGTGAMYDLEGDKTPWAPFQYQVVCRMPGEPVYHVVITYAPDNVWYMAYRLSADGRQKEGDTTGMNQYFFPAAVLPQSPFYGVAKKK